MSLGQRLQEALEEIKAISKMEGAVYAKDGKVEATTLEEEEDLSRQARRFSQFPAEAMTEGGFHYFSIDKESPKEGYVLAVRATSAESYMLGQLAVCQLRELIRMSEKKTNKGSFFREALTGDAKGEELYGRAERLHIPELEWDVYVVRTKDRRERACKETLRGLFSNKDSEFLIEMDEWSLVLIRGVKEESDPLALAHMILDTLQAEAMQQVSVGYGTRAKGLAQLPAAYNQALAALEIGKIFYGQRHIFSYENLGVGRLIYQLPKDMGDHFLFEVFGGKEELLTEEDLMTVQRFFENDLNVSETARQMYIHRNTLVYRLERIDKILGLDVRRFEDAVKFKLALMLKERGEA